MQYGRTKFIDSLNYFQIKLSALPAAFGLPENSIKDYFPHLLNTLQNQEYAGPLPDANFYAPNSMSIDERKDFLNGTKRTNETMYSILKQKSSSIVAWMYKFYVAPV